MYYFIAPDANAPIGGIRFIYQQVDILNSHGIDAIVVHSNPGFRCSWFHNQTRITSMREMTPRSDDVLVIPEINGPAAADLYPGIRKIILNQNGHYTFDHYSIEPTAMQTPYCGHDDVLGVVTVSPDTKAYLEYIFPSIKVKCVTPGVDSSVFYYNGAKQRQLTFMVTKSTRCVLQVINALKFRGALREWRLKPMLAMPLDEAARTIRESAIYLHFGHREGLSIPPIEALSCGTAAIGYSGNTPPLIIGAYPHTAAVTPGDYLGYIKAVEQKIDLFDNHRDQFDTDSQDAFNQITDIYSIENYVKSTLYVWTSMTGSIA